MDSKIDQILELIKKYQMILLSKKRLSILKDEIQKEKENQIHLNDKLLEEHRDIVELERFSLQFLFNKILINDKQQIEKEKQEYLVAVLRYNESTKLINLLEYEIGVLTKIASDEEIILQTINTALNNSKHEALLNSSPFLAELKNVNKEISNLIRLNLEAEEALEAVQILRSTFIELIQNLNKAQESNSWGKFYHEIQKEKTKKKSAIDKAHSSIPIIKKILYLLKNELLDVQDYQKLFKSSELMIRGFNIKFYNDLISDWINDENLIDTLSTTMGANSNILRLRKSLVKLISNTKEEMPHVLLRRSKLLEKIDATKS